MPDVETTEAKRKRLLAEKEKRDDAEIEAAKLREIQELELDEKYSRELGPRGVAFDILKTSKGPIAVRLGEAVLYKRFRAKYVGEKEPTLEDIQAFVQPCVLYPERDIFLDLIDKHAMLGSAIANLLADLYVAKEKDTRGK
jgi:hypothetical protein